MADDKKLKETNRIKKCYFLVDQININDLDLKTIISHKDIFITTLSMKCHFT